jgi:hypothetical protein
MMTHPAIQQFLVVVLHADTEGRKARPGIFHRPDQQRSHTPCLYERYPAFRRLVRQQEHQ